MAEREAAARKARGELEGDLAALKARAGGGDEGALALEKKHRLAGEAALTGLCCVAVVEVRGPALAPRRTAPAAASLLPPRRIVLRPVHIPSPSPPPLLSAFPTSAQPPQPVCGDPRQLSRGG